jgi:Fur family transcriptional regulator, ferric uptake regulator
VAPQETAEPLSPLQALLETLRRHGVRLTPQREKIIEHFHQLPEGDHLTAEQLHQDLQTTQAGISLATTYRTLKLLASVGVLRELDFAEDHKHYELAREDEAPHHHLICVHCGLTVEFESPSVVDLGQTIAAQHRFQIKDVQLKVFGICQACQQQALLWDTPASLSRTLPPVAKRRSSLDTHPKQ